MPVIVNLLSKFDDSGIKKAKKSFGGLKATLGAIGLGIGFKAIADELNQAVKNAQADVISQKQLARQLKITANATDQQVAAQEDYISKLSMATGVVDDELRPAYGVLLRATGSVTKAQKLLGISLDTSAGTGKNLEIVTKSIARAYGGNVSGLQKLVPGIKKGSDAMGFLEKQFAGARETLANPFDRLQIAVDETKEKIGMLLLPQVQKFADFMIEKVIPQVQKFLDDVSNPNTEAGKTFIEIKKAVGDTIQGVKDFFALFGGGDAMEGFKNVASNLIRALPALLALKGILVLAKAGSAIANLAKAVGLIQGQSVLPGGGTTAPPIVGGGKAVPGAGGLKVLSFMKLAPLIGVGMGSTEGPVTGIKKNANGTYTADEATLNYLRKGLKPEKPTVNNININVQNADPKATVDALSKYLKQNGYTTLGQALRN